MLSLCNDLTQFDSSICTSYYWNTIDTVLCAVLLIFACCYHIFHYQTTINNTHVLFNLAT